VTGVDCFPLASGNSLDEFIEHDLNRGMPDVDLARFDYVLLLDVVEHLASPESFVQSLRKKLERHPEITIIVSSGNIAFLIPRLMLLLGQFNYGKRGILDMTHTRLYTFSSFRRLFKSNGFQEMAHTGLPGPFPLALGDNWLSRSILALDELGIRLSKGLFSYQMFLVLRSLPSLAYLLERSIEESESRARLQTPA
jgi:hypothetical protein